MDLIHPDTMAAIEALRTKSARVEYCDPCDGIRIVGHICTCWECRALVQTAPNPDCWACQFITRTFFQKDA
jgi:hypothetical protein